MKSFEGSFRKVKPFRLSRNMEEVEALRHCEIRIKTRFREGKKLALFENNKKPREH